MRKIIHWHEKFDTIGGGGPSYINNLVRNLNQDYQHEIVTDNVKNHSRVEMCSGNSVIRRFPSNPLFLDTNFHRVRLVSYPFRVINDLLCLYSKYSFLNTAQFDVLHVHGISFYHAVLRLNQILHKDIYQKVINFSFVEKPKLLTLHNFPLGFTDDRIVTSAYNHYVDQFDNVICVDRHIYDYCIAYCRRKRCRKKIWYITNCIDTELYRNIPSRKKGIFRVGFVGRLAGTVDFDVINRLILHLPKDMEFHAAVTGNLDLLEKSEPSCDRIRIYKDVPQSEMPKFYHAIDVLVNPIVHEGISRVTLEAMACGKPVIMYDIGNRYPLVSGKSGYLVNRSAKCIFDTLAHIHKNQKELVSIGLNAREVVKNEYSNDVVIPKIKKIYESIISES